MSISELPDPVITSQVFLSSFKKMSGAEYEKVLQDILDRGSKFIALDDSEFSGSLSQEDATLYASTCQLFLNAFKDLKQVSHNKRLSMSFLARAIAWWQCVSAFRTLCGKSS